MNANPTIAGILGRLPDDIREIVADESLDELLVGIAHNQNIPMAQTSAFQDEIIGVLLGSLSLEGLPMRISARLHVPESRAYEILREVDERIFSYVRHSLEKMHGIDSSFWEYFSRAQQASRAADARTPGQTAEIATPPLRPEPPQKTRPASDMSGTDSPIPVKNIFEEKLKAIVGASQTEGKQSPAPSAEPRHSAQIPPAPPPRALGRDPYREPPA